MKIQFQINLLKTASIQQHNARQEIGIPVLITYHPSSQPLISTPCAQLLRPLTGEIQHTLSERWPERNVEHFVDESQKERMTSAGQKMILNVSDTTFIT